MNANSASPPNRPETPNPGDPRRGRSVLLYDPLGEYWAALQELFAERGDRLEIHEQSESAWNAWCSGTFVLLLVIAPDGLELSRRASRDRSAGAAQILALVDRSHEDLVGDLASAGVDDYLIWPAAPRELETRLRLAERRRRDGDPERQPFYERPELFRLLADTMKEGLGVRDAEGRIVYVNEYLCRMLGYSRREILGRKVSDFLDEPSAKLFAEQARRRPVARSSTYELTMLHKSGHRIPTMHSGQALHSKEGTFRGSFAVITNVAERQQILERLLRREDALRSADEGGHDHVLARLDLENTLRRAVDQWQFEVLYQPIVELESRRLAGFEALVRWHHPEGGVVLPDDFIPLAEEIGVIDSLDFRILAEACVQMREWQADAALERQLFLTVNLSGRQLLRRDLVEQVVRVLGESGLGGESLVVEIAERSLGEPLEEKLAVLERLRSRGVTLLLDDFGSGRVSLAGLRRPPFDLVKIDRWLVRHLGSEGGADELVEELMASCRDRGLATLAVGVETEPQRQRLLDFGCHYGQGHFFSTPLGAVGAGELVARDEPLA